MLALLFCKGDKKEIYLDAYKKFENKCIKIEEEQLMKRKWTKETAQAYIKKAKEKGLIYWSAVDYLRNHK